MVFNKLFFELVLLLLIIGFAVVGVYTMLLTILNAQTIYVPAVINSDTQYPLLIFSKSHSVNINGKQKAVWNSYQITQKDLVEGVNTIMVQRQTTLGIRGLEKVYKVFVDRTSPKLELVSLIPQEVVGLYELDIYLNQEEYSKLFYNDFKLDPKDKKVTIPLKAGFNIGKFTSVDTNQNISKPLEVVINNIFETRYKYTKCNQIGIALDTNQLQIGYSSLEGKAEITNENNPEFAKLNLPQCESKSDTQISILPVGAKAKCLKCNDNNEYITISNTKGILNRPPILDQLKYPNVVKSNEYISKSGLIGDFIKKRTNFDLADKDGKVNPISEVSLSYEFIIDGEPFEIAGTEDTNNPINANFEADFMSVVDHVYITNRSQDQNNGHTDNQQLQQFKVNDFLGLQFQYQPDWKVSYELEKVGPEISDKKTQNVSNIVVLEKGAYTIEIIQSLKDKGGQCSDPYKPETKKYYTERFIDGVKLLVPLVTQTKSQKIFDKDINLIVVGQDQYGNTVANCLFKVGQYDYRITISTDDKDKPLNDFDKSIEKEIIELLTSIKWY
jgi:hypothetical protein